MKIKDGKIKIYEVDKDYLSYLCQFDNNVRLKSERRYIGIIVSNQGIDYCIPLTCKIKRRNPKLTIDIKDKGKIIAQLTINNMIPVTDSVIHATDISKDKFKDYLNSEVIFLRNKMVLQSILHKTENIMSVLLDSSDKDFDFFKKLCTNYILLESKCREYTELNQNSRTGRMSDKLKAAQLKADKINENRQKIHGRENELMKQ